jgi:hypothetical protein
MSQTNLSGRPRRIVWQSVITVLSAAVLISAEVFGADFAGGWALASLMGLGTYGVYELQTLEAVLRRAQWYERFAERMMTAVRTAADEHVVRRHLNTRERFSLIFCSEVV